MTKPLKIMTVVGARPQFIKAAVVSTVLRAEPEVQEVLVHTGQHYDEGMSAVFFRELAIPEPDVNLGVGSDRHGAQTGRMLDGLERLMIQTGPDWVLVYGDTNSTLAGALAASKLRLRVAHVEAGLRSFNRAMPEEINRVITDHVADLLLAPTQAAVDNLKREGIGAAQVLLVGDVMYDAALLYGRRAEQQSSILDVLGLQPHGYVLATVHRAENTEDPRRLTAVLEGLTKLSEHVPVVLPLHPRTRKVLGALLGGEETRRDLRIIDPVGYLDMILLEKRARLIVTDSGGVQKEAFFHAVPCATLREETEWVELVRSGWNHLVPPRSPRQVYEGLHRILALGTPGSREDFYGRGAAAQAIVAALKNHVEHRS